MEYFGKLTNKYEAVEIETKNGPKAKMTFVIQQPGQYGKPAAFETLNSAAISFLNDTKIGTELKVIGDVASRECNGRWYTNLTAGIIEISKAPAASNVEIDKHPTADDINKKFDVGETSSNNPDDLPF